MTSGGVGEETNMVLDEHGHHVMSDGWCTQCEAWHHDAPDSVRHPYPPDPVAALHSIPIQLFAGASRYTTDNTHVLHLWDDDGHSFDIIWQRDKQHRS